MSNYSDLFNFLTDEHDGRESNYAVHDPSKRVIRSEHIANLDTKQTVIKSGHVQNSDTKHKKKVMIASFPIKNELRLKFVNGDGDLNYQLVRRKTKVIFSIEEFDILFKITPHIQKIVQETTAKACD